MENAVKQPRIETITAAVLGVIALGWAAFPEAGRSLPAGNKP
jgi:hypothetical protein